MITIYVSQEEGVVRVSCKGKFRDILLELTVAVTDLLGRMSGGNKMVRNAMIDHLIDKLESLKNTPVLGKNKKEEDNNERREPDGAVHCDGGDAPPVQEGE